jgi:hypothetical protein
MRYYVKVSKSDDHARNEVLASKLYALAGVPAVHAELVEHNGRLATASLWIEGTVQDLGSRLANADSGYLAQVRQGFIIDAWLANWDVAGLVYDNIVSTPEDTPLRVDTGGCLFFRAMGYRKGSAFNDEASEFDTLRDFETAPQAAHLFARITNTEMIASALKLAMISDQQIAETVESVGFHVLTAAQLIMKLCARRTALLERVTNI